MPQEQHVVRCYACKKFQVQIMKKVPKWQCKVCNEKQSVLKVYAKGSGKDCRQFVQDLNMQQGLLMSKEPTEDDTGCEKVDEVDLTPPQDSVYTELKGRSSKWSEYLENQSECTQENCTQDPTMEFKNDEFFCGASIFEGAQTHVKNASKGGEYLQNNGLNNVVTEDHGPLRDSKLLMSEGRKRKHNKLVSSDVEGNFIACQLNSKEVSSISNEGVMSEITDSFDLKRMKSNVLAPQVPMAGFKQSSSKWVQYVAPEDRPTSSIIVRNNWDSTQKHSKHQVLSKKLKIEDSPKSNSYQFHPSMSHSIKHPCKLSSRSNAPEKVAIPIVPLSENQTKTGKEMKSPFCTTEDYNLDSLLDF